MWEREVRALDIQDGPEDDWASICSIDSRHAACNSKPRRCSVRSPRPALTYRSK
jgi:hypothetical protein